MARKSKFEEEKNRLDCVREITSEAITDIERTERSFSGSGEYEHALIYQRFSKKLREIKTACGEEKPKEDKN